MQRLLLLLVFLIPFQARIYKFLTPLSLSWIDSSWHLPPYFVPSADLFITDFLLLILLLAVAKFSDKYLAMFLGVALLSIVVSDYASYPLPYWRWSHLVLASSLFIGVQRFRVPLESIARVVMTSSLVVCAVALSQYVMQHHLGLKILGEPTLISRHTLGAHFLMPKKAITSIDYFWNSEAATSTILRAAGTLPHPNVLGCFLLFSLIMTLYLYEKSEKKGIIGFCLVMQIITLFTTFSRAAIFAFAGASLLLLFKNRAIWKPLLIGIATSLFLFFPQLFYRGGVVSASSTGPALQADAMRVSMQHLAIQVIKDHPWFGVGFNNYLLAIPSYIQGQEVDAIFVHNIYLLIAAEMGLIGLGIFLLFCGYLLYRGWKTRDTLEGRVLLILFVSLLAIGWVDYHPFVVQQIRMIFFLTAGLLATRSCVIRNDLHTVSSLRAG